MTHFVLFLVFFFIYSSPHGGLGLSGLLWVPISALGKRGGLESSLVDEEGVSEARGALDGSGFRLEAECLALGEKGADFCKKIHLLT